MEEKISINRMDSGQSQKRLATESSNMHTFSVRYQGQVYILKSSPAATAGQILAQFREEHDISRFRSLELRLDDKPILYKKPVRLGYSNIGSALEIVPRSCFNCFQ